MTTHAPVLCAVVSCIERDMTSKQHGDECTLKIRVRFEWWSVVKSNLSTPKIKQTWATDQVFVQVNASESSDLMVNERLASRAEVN